MYFCAFSLVQSIPTLLIRHLTHMNIFTVKTCEYTVHDVQTLTYCHLFIFLENNTWIKKNWFDFIETLFASKPLFSPIFLKELSKTAMRRPVEQISVNHWFGRILCTRTQPSSSHNFVCSHWGFKIVCFSQLCSLAIILQFNWVKV